MTSDADVPGSTRNLEESDRIVIQRLQTQWRWGHWIVCPDLEKHLREDDFDIIHAQSYRNYFSEVGAKVAFLRGIPFVLTPRGSLRGYRYIGATGLSWLPNIAFDLVTRRQTLRRALIITTSPAE